MLTSLATHGTELLSDKTLLSSTADDLRRYDQKSKSEELMLHEAQGLSTHVTQPAYDTIEHGFLTQVSQFTYPKCPAMQT